MAIRIAIIGGGIAGLCLARGLSKYAHLSITVYESTSRYLDIGGGLAFHGNAMRALALIDPELQAEYFRRATLMSEMDVEMATQVLVGDLRLVGDGKGKGEGEAALLAELGKAKGRKTVARCDLLEGLLSLVPEGVVKTGKRLDSMEETTSGIHLVVKDGTEEKADVVIGCDGVHSVVRKHLLGADHPALELRNHDGWDWVGRSVPADEVKALNPNLLAYVPILCGKGAYMNCIPTHFGKVLNVTVVHVSKEAKGDGKEAGDLEDKKSRFAVDDFAHWTKDARDIATLALRDPRSDWKLADHDPAPFYARKNICMIGDAAHATMPFNGQGAAQSIEDVAMLTALFEHVVEIGQVEKALKVWDELRRPRTQRVVEISREFGRMYAFAEDFQRGEKGSGSENEVLGEMRRRMGVGARFTNEVDLEALNAEAVKRFLG